MITNYWNYRYINNVWSIIFNIYKLYKISKIVLYLHNELYKMNYIGG